MADESVSLPVTPERSDNRTNSDGWRHSTGNMSFLSSQPHVLSRYLRASTGSCHDFCKYGRHSESKAKERYLIPKRTIRKHEGDETPIQNPYITEQKAKSMPSSNAKSNSDPLGKRCITKSNQLKSGKADSCKNIASSSKSRPLQLSSSLSNSSDGWNVERSSKHGAGKDLKTHKAAVIEVRPPVAPALLPNTAVIEALPPIDCASLRKASVIEAVPPVAPSSLSNPAVIGGALPPMASASLPKETVLEPLATIAPASLPNTAVIEAPLSVAPASLPIGAVKEDLPQVAPASLPNTAVTDLPPVAPASLPLEKVIEMLPSIAPASLSKASVIEALPPVALASFSKATVTEDVPPVAPALLPKPVLERASKHKINSPTHKNRNKTIESKNFNLRSSDKYARRYKNTKIMASTEQNARSGSTQNLNENGKMGSTKTMVVDGTGSETTQSQQENGSKRISYVTRSSKVVSSVKCQITKGSKSYIKKNENKFLHAHENGDEKMILECADYEKLTEVTSDHGNPNQSECTAMEASETIECSSDNGQAQRVSISEAPYCSSKSRSRKAKVSEVTPIKMTFRRVKDIELPSENKSPRRPKFSGGRLWTKKSLLLYANKEKLTTMESGLRSPDEYDYTVRETSEESKCNSNNDQAQTLSSSVAPHHSSKSCQRIAEISKMGMTPAKLTFKRGKIIKLPLENKSPRLLKFKQGRQLIKKSLLECDGNEKFPPAAGSDLGSHNESEYTAIEARKTSKSCLASDRVRTPNSSGASRRSSKSRSVISKIPEIVPTKLTFRKGKTVELPSENDSPSWLKLKRDGILSRESFSDCADEEKLGAVRSEGENPNEYEYTAGSTGETVVPISDNDHARTQNTHQMREITPTKLKFRRGKVIDVASEIRSPRRLKFKQGITLADSEDVCADVRRRSFRRIVPGDDGRTSRHGSVKVVLKHRDVEGKTNAQGLLNNVIEETASKLVEVRKSKVQALVGAFETVISLQESNPSSSVVH